MKLSINKKRNRGNNSEYWVYLFLLFTGFIFVLNFSYSTSPLTPYYWGGDTAQFLTIGKAWCLGKIPLLEEDEMLISLVVPCYNEEESLPIFYKEICKVSEEMAQFYNTAFEFVFVNDGSKDKTLDILRSFAQKDSRVRYISFSRNFGKESAMYAGFQTCTGDYAAVMDADMQDPPSLLPEMYKALQTGEYDSVATRRVDRKGEPPIRSFFARCFYKIINKMSDADIVDGARDFRLMKRKMVDAIVSMGEYNRFSKGIFGWVGFRTKWLPYENVERVAGTTKWNFWKLFKYSIEGIVGFSTAPLLLAVCIGLAFCALAFIGIVFVIVRALAFGDPTSGWPSLVCIILLCSGVQLMCTGIAGEYLAKTYLEVKHRPIYIVAETEEDLSKKELTQCN